MTNTEILDALEEKWTRYAEVDFLPGDDGFSTGCDDWPTENIYFDKKFKMISLIDDRTKFMIDFRNLNFVRFFPCNNHSRASKKVWLFY